MEMAGWSLLDGMIHVFQYVLFKVFASIHTFQVLPKLLKKETPTLTSSISNFNWLGSVHRLFFMGPEGYFPALFNVQTQNSKVNAILSGSSVQHLLSMLTSKEQRHNRCLAEAAHQNGRPVPLHWHSHDFNPLEAHSSTTIFSMLLCLRIQFAHINTSLLMNLLSFLVSSCFFRLSLAYSSSLKLYSAVVLHTSLVCTWVKKAKEERQCHWDKKRYYTVIKTREDRCLHWKHSPPESLGHSACGHCGCAGQCSA